MKPALYVIKTFGGVRATARALKLSPSSVSRWTLTGLVPARHHVRILDRAKKMGKDLTAHHLTYGNKP